MGAIARWPEIGARQRRGRAVRQFHELATAFGRGRTTASGPAHHHPCRRSIVSNSRKLQTGNERTGDPPIIGQLEVIHLRGNHHSIERLSGHPGQLYLNRGRHSVALPKSLRIVEP
jgi:hypothetical protein